MKPQALAIAVVALALSACAATAAAFGTPTGTVSGHATVRACGGPARVPPMDVPCQARPLVGVTVTFQPQAGGQALIVKTDSAGFYSIKLRPGAYTASLAMKYPKLPLPAAGTGAFADGGQTGASAAYKSVGPITGMEKKTVTVAAGQTVTADFAIVFNAL